MTSIYDMKVEIDASDCSDSCECCEGGRKGGRIVRCEAVTDNHFVVFTETGGAYDLIRNGFTKVEITKEEFEMAIKKGKEQAEEHNQKVQNGSLSVDELMEKFNFEGSKIRKHAAKKIRVKTAQQPRSKPRILRTKVSRLGKPATLNRQSNSPTNSDTDSQKSNAYNKRFTKTKKPARL